MSRRLRRLALRLASSDALPYFAVRHILVRLGLDVDRTALVLPGFRMLLGPGRLAIGAGAFVNVGCYLDLNADIEIEAGVFLADHVRLVTGTHDLGPADQRAGPARALPVKIETGAWLGSGVTVLPGVTVGAGCVVAAGAVVVRHCSPNGMYAGVPARRLKDLDPS